MDTDPTKRSKRPVLRYVLIVLATLIGAALVTAPTVATVLGKSRPEIALGFWPIDAGAQASHAADLVAADLGVETLARADTLSRAALQREPINVTAARVQAMVAAGRGNTKGSQAWLNYAESLSRRDFPVQAMLIEMAVLRDDIPGALVHYDRALRTKKGAGDVLFPILFGAAADPAVLPALTRLLAQRPEWWYDFTVRWVTQSPPVAPLYTVLAATRPNIAEPRERQLVITAMRQMVTAGRIDLAARLHDKVAPNLPPAGSLVDGDFAMKSDLAPFAWDLTGEIGMSGVVEQRGERSRPALTLDIGSDQGGTVAQQLLRLAPGQYRLAFRTGDLAPDGVVPTIRVQCAPNGEILADHVVEPGPATRAFTFTTPRTCPAQSLQIRGRAGNNDGLTRPWITDMVMRKTG